MTRHSARARAPRSLGDEVSRPFRPLTGVVLVLLLLSAGTTGAELAVFTPRLDQAGQTVALLNTSQRAVADQETGVRAFLLAPAGADQAILPTYVRGRRAYRDVDRQLLRGGTGRLERALATRAAAVEQWHAQWVRAAVGDPAGKPTSPAFLRQGTVLFEDYRVADAEAAALLDARVEELLRWQARTAAAGGLAGLLVVLGALTAVARTRRRLLGAVARPLREVADAVRAGSAGDLSGTVPTSCISELDELARDVTALFGSLRERDAALRAQTRELQVLEAASRALLTDPDPRTAICRAAASVTGGPHAYLFEPAGDALVDTASLGSPAGQLVLPMDGDSLAVQVFRSRRSVLVDDVHADPRVSQRVVGDMAPTGGAWLPVLFDERCLGVLVVAMPLAMTAMAQSVPGSLQVLAGAAAAAIDRADLHQRLAELARTDGLTGVANRRAWDAGLAEELARAARTGRPLAVALLDLDHFKSYNDSHGHQAGDQLLRAVAHGWSAGLRGNDLLARYGGEEFAVALPDCDLERAHRLLDVLRRQLPEGQTCSVGVTVWDGSEPPHDVLFRADRALYAAKNAGRDRLVATSPPPATTPSAVPCAV